MKLKQSIRYQLEDFQMGILVYYCAAIAMTVLAFLAFAVYPGDSGIRVTGFSAITSVFLFVCGLCSLHENLPMALQNGVSRKTMFLARLAVTAITSAFCAVTDHVITAAANLAAQPCPWEIRVPSGAALPRGPSRSSRAVADRLPAIQLFHAAAGFNAGLLYHLLVLPAARLPAGGSRRSRRDPFDVWASRSKSPGYTPVPGAASRLLRPATLEPLVNAIVSNPFSLMGSWVLAAGALSGISWLLLRRAIVR